MSIKKRLLWVTLSIPLFAIVLLVLLIRFSPKPNSKKNGFVRTLLSSQLRIIKENKIKEPLFKFVGKRGNYLYFSTKYPEKLIVFDFTLSKEDSLKIALPYDQRLRIFDSMADSNKISIFAPNLGSLFSYNIANKKLDTIRFETPLFSRYAKVCNNRIAVRGFDSVRQKQAFYILQRNTGKPIYKNIVFNNQPDAGFSTDGALLFDNATQRLFYVQCFQNRFFCMDTCLRLIYTAHTIDTTNTNIVSAVNRLNENKNGSIMPSVPLSHINKTATLYKDNLLVLSNLKADNETDSAFVNNLVVDLYRLDNGKYKASFYIPNAGTQKLLSFQIVDTFLIGIYEDKISLFKLNL